MNVITFVTNIIVLEANKLGDYHYLLIIELNIALSDTKQRYKAVSSSSSLQLSCAEICSDQILYEQNHTL